MHEGAFTLLLLLLVPTSHLSTIASASKAPARCRQRAPLFFTEAFHESAVHGLLNQPFYQADFTRMVRSHSLAS